MLDELFRLDGKVAIVTGASSGLGSRFASVLSNAGATVVLAARRLEPLRDLAAVLPSARAQQCDVTSETECADLVQSTMDTYGQIDVLVNNAGISRPAKVEAETTEDFRQVVDVNLIALYRMCRLVGLRMLARGQGSIVNVGSIVGLVGVGRMPQASYAASKGAVTNLTRELAAQWARKGIRVNAIAPGFFPSEMTGELLASDKGRAWVDNLTPMGRAGREGELDGALLYLASQASSYVTGSVLAVDGGWTAV
jgi:NAD(P)-dependent dehydrogenase (short-subunit alcohol dehydrogenase family)